MRVVLVVDVFPKVSTTFIAAKFVGLIDRGIDAHIVCWTSDPDMWDRIATLAERPELKDRIHLVASPVKPWTVFGPARHAGRDKHTPGAFESVRGALKSVRQALKSVRQASIGGCGFEAWLDVLKPDLVHFEFGARAARYLTAGSSFRWPVVVSFRGYDLNCIGLDRPDYYAGVWAQADALHLLGDDLWQRALRRGAPPDKTHVLIPPAVDTTYFSPGGLSAAQDGDPAEAAAMAGVVGTAQRPLRILSVGRLHWKKGTEWALAAVGLLVERGVVVDYRIVGDGAEADSAIACIRDLKLEASVTMLGSRRRHEVRDELARADVFLHAAVSEGFCNSVMEAQSMQVPVVCTDADGLGENVADGVTGYVVSRRDPVAMADGLELLAGDGALRGRMGAAGRERVAGRFRPADQIDAFAALYSAVTSHAAATSTATASSSGEAPSPTSG